ncbi:type VII secretion protein EccCa [Cellulomonas aerilata]|uniref:Type VII secretion protein EccC n=1 Tax=Cellulomonas aerilata TaxID=515326 RepID=A0A512DFJ4_9CELL|nr:type VII secretion protein EccCa [Cellulomonas aerilata]GEO35237.1 type VII secretion protein EccC [Cellulomonas aerilata]
MAHGTDEQLRPPQLPTGRIELDPPPELYQGEGLGGSLMMLLPMLGGLGSVVFVAVANPGPLGLIAGGLFFVTMAGFVGVTLWRNVAMRRARVTDNRRSYLRYLGKVREQARRAAAQQRQALTWRFPAPHALPFVAAEPARVWTHEPEDPNFLLVRYGTGPQQLATELVPPDTDAMDTLDPVTASALHRLLKTHRVQPDLPSTVLLRGFARIEVTGGAEDVRALARAMVCSAAVSTAPADLLVAVVAGSQEREQWEWVKWLPHAHSPVAVDAAGPARLVVDDVDDLLALLPPEVPNRGRFVYGDESSLPHLLLVVDGGHAPATSPLLPPEGVAGITVMELPEAWGELAEAARLRLHVERSPHHDKVMVSAVRPRMEPVSGEADAMSVTVAQAVARRLTPLGDDHRVGEGDGVRQAQELTDLLGLGDVRDLDVRRAWRPRPERDRLRVPIGVSPDGTPVYLDLKESAQQGMGPHGLVIGATGSGKSELLRTLVLALAMTHSSETLNFVLVDFKGGASFAGMAGLPHVSAVITNLSEELSLVDRMQDALSGEMVRRQEILRRSGNYQSVRDYERDRAAGADFEPLPSLLVVVDEFSELLAAKQEFADLFVVIGRLGRSLGIHLLLSSQRLDEGRLRGLESHLSYRVGLRTFSAAESRAVLGVTDAYELPPVPGRGYLKGDQATLQAFQAAYVSGPPPSRGGTVDDHDTGPARVQVLPFRAAPVHAEDDLLATGVATGAVVGAGAVAPADDGAARRRGADPLVGGSSGHGPAGGPATGPARTRAEKVTTFDLAVRAMVGRGPAAHEVWLPPLDVPDTFDALMPDLAADPELGLVSRAWREHGVLTFPIGTVDVPREQRREPVVCRLAGAGGHVGVVGGPHSGRSTLLRSIVTGLALTHTPQEAQVYVLDFGGGTFAALSGLPHVAGIGTRAEPDVVRRVVAEVSGIVEARERGFRRHRIDGIENYRSRRAEVDDGYGDVFLVVDGWATLRSDFEALESELQLLAQRALTYGVHLLTSATRWTDYRPAVRDIIATRYELRLGDPFDSGIDRKVAVNVPTDRPGRGVVASGLHFLGALPRIDARPQPSTLRAGVDHLVSSVAAAWHGPAGPKLRLLPGRVPLEDVRAAAPATTSGLLLGLDERALAPVVLDVRSDPHLLVYGDGRAGKSAVLRTYLSEVMRTRTPREAAIFLVDYRRAHLGFVPEEYLASFSSNAGQAAADLEELAEFLRTRIPGADVTPQQLRERSWWSGREAFVVVDDYELVATASGNPLAPLLPLLAQAQDVGLHVVLARRAAGSTRAYDGFLAALADLAPPGIVLSGDPGEGALLRTVRPVHQPPGRGRLVTRDPGFQVVQTAWVDPVG